MQRQRNLLERDLQHVWHPCAQMKDYELFKPLDIVSARGCYLETREGKKIIDGTASWWCKSLGHHHPRLKQGMLLQLEKFEHVMLAHTTNEAIVALSEKLAELTSTLTKVLYASDGSSAVEMAMKMSLHSRHLQGQPKKNGFVALAQGYHGETVGALSVSDLGLYRQPYTSMLFPVHFISSIPYVDTVQHPLWADCQPYWNDIEKQLESVALTTTALILEPIVQGAGGMKIYSQDFLKRLRAYTAAHDIHLIADEIMTGIGRTGKMLACQHANIEPDFLCLSKGLTSGWLPLSAMLTSVAMYDLFYGDDIIGKAFLHSHTHAGNALAASVALEVLKVVEEEKLCEQANVIGRFMHESMLELAADTKKIKQVRSIGAITAAELVGQQDGRRLGFDFYRKAADLGALLRPLGNTLYWLPPLTIDKATLVSLRDITRLTLLALN